MRTKELAELHIKRQQEYEAMTWQQKQVFHRLRARKVNSQQKSQN